MLSSVIIGLKPWRHLHSPCRNDRRVHSRFPVNDQQMYHLEVLLSIIPLDNVKMLIACSKDVTMIFANSNVVVVWGLHKVLADKAEYMKVQSHWQQANHRILQRLSTDCHDDGSMRHPGIYQQPRNHALLDTNGDGGHGDDTASQAVREMSILASSSIARYLLPCVPIIKEYQHTCRNSVDLDVPYPSHNPFSQRTSPLDVAKLVAEVADPSVLCTPNQLDKETGCLTRTHGESMVILAGRES